MKAVAHCSKCLFARDPNRPCGMWPGIIPDSSAVVLNCKLYTPAKEKPHVR
mgnify:FL=1